MSHSLEGELNHWVDKFKYVWLTAGQLLQYFRHKHKIPTTEVTEHNPELPPAPTLYSHLTQNKKINF